MSLKNFEILSTLGEGSYSTVFKAKRITDSQIYALKKVRIQSLKEKEKKNALNEIRILASITHPNIISYKEAFFDEESRSLCLVIEFAPHGDLYQRILSYQKKGLYMHEKYIWRLIVSLTKGLKALHDLGILHRDIKSANVFLCNDGEFKLGDMNVSKVSKDRAMHTQTGTPYYASPEVWKDVPYDSKSDMWSLGCVFYEAIALKPPFRADDMEALYKKVTKGEFPRIPKHFSHDLQAIVRGLLCVDPTKRYSCKDILAMPVVLRHVTGEEDEGESSLLQTIKFPNNFQLISGQLPRPKYLDNQRRYKSSLISVAKEEEKKVLKKEFSEVIEPRVKNLKKEFKLPKVVYKRPSKVVVSDPSLSCKVSYTKKKYLFNLF